MLKTSFSYARIEKTKKFAKIPFYNYRCEKTGCSILFYPSIFRKTEYDLLFNFEIHM